MSATINPASPKSAKPVVAGILNIIAGSFCVMGALIAGFGALMFIPASSSFFEGLPRTAGISFLGIVLIAIPVIILGAISITDGVYNLQRRKWGWALADSITTTIMSAVLGVTAIILTAISREEFVH